MIKIGCDPEFFVFDTLEKRYVSAHTLVPGTKANPSPLPSGGAVQADGLAIEFNIEPTSNVDEFFIRVVGALNDIRRMVPERYVFKFLSAVPFSREYLDSLPEEVRRLGCNPDFNAYTGKPNPTPNADTPMRTGSGHIHIGWTEGADIEDPDHLEACQMAVTALDITLGAYMYNLDYDSPRKILYGNAGAYRPKSYGVEYRTPSNRWLESAGSMKTVYRLAESTITALMEGTIQYRNNDFPRQYTSQHKRRWMMNYLKSSKVAFGVPVTFYNNVTADMNNHNRATPIEYIELAQQLFDTTPINKVQIIRDEFGRFAPKVAQG